MVRVSTWVPEAETPSGADCMLAQTTCSDTVLNAIANEILNEELICKRREIITADFVSLDLFLFV